MTPLELYELTAEYQRDPRESLVPVLVYAFHKVGLAQSIIIRPDGLFLDIWRVQWYRRNGITYLNFPISGFLAAKIQNQLDQLRLRDWYAKIAVPQIAEVPR